MTKQRRIILEVLRQTDCHPTAEWIYGKARQLIPDISLGTVYRNLQFLVREQELQEFKDDSRFSRFDGRPEPHYHFLCHQCGAVMDVQMPLMDSLDEQAAAYIPGRVDSHRLEFSGVCRECLGRSQEMSADSGGQSKNGKG